MKFNKKNDHELVPILEYNKLNHFIFGDIMKNLFSLSLSTRVLLGLTLGIISGLLFGEKLSFLDVVGEAFIMLLQMAVLPYIILSLISGI